VAFRVIADHIRTLSFAIADGIVPSNEGRGYVLRRILRRAVRYGRTIGFHEPFFYKLTDVLVRTMGQIFPEVVAKQQLVSETISREERAFSNTLDRGIELFEDKVREIEKLRRSSAKEIDEGGEIRGSGFVLSRDRRLLTGDFPFQLYDTYGFPLDLTELMARERGLAVDVAGFEELMGEQRNRARKAQKKQAITLEEEKLAAAPTNFLGYDFLETEAMVESVLEGSEPNEFNIVLDRTPCYAEMGGQVGDHGLLHVPGHDRTEVGRLTISDTQKRGNVVVHISKLGEGRPPEPGEAVRLSVDTTRRKPVERHHTVTHLLHWALHQIVSPDAAQKGSYVGPDKLTFDFSSSALTSEQKRNVENLVNQKVLEDAPVTWTEIPYAEAKKRSDIQQFFGDKYGETVRVVQIGGKSGALNGYSMELCGGTHVRATGEVGPFRILKEEAIAAGIRRIEAVAGDAARDWAKQEAQRQQERFEALARKKEGIAPLPPFSPETETSALLKQIDSRLAYLEKLDSEVHQWEKQQSKASEADLKNRAEIIAKELAAANAGKKSCVAEMPNADGKLLQAIVDALKSKIVGPIFLAGASDGRVALVASVPKELTSQYQANKLIQEVAPIVGGKGGGRPENAQGAGKDVTKIEEALARVRELISI
jgi:alanyl-tRNA synthetase